MSHLKEHTQMMLEGCVSAEQRWKMQGNRMKKFREKLLNARTCSGILVHVKSQAPNDPKGAGKFYSQPQLIPFEDGVYDCWSWKFTPGFQPTQYIEYTFPMKFPGVTDGWDQEIQDQIDALFSLTVQQILVEEEVIDLYKRHNALSLSNE